jgi:hypothetical protein
MRHHHLKPDMVGGVTTFRQISDRGDRHTAGRNHLDLIL